MKNKLLLTVIIIISQIIVGCSRISESVEMQSAVRQLENHNYDKAVELLSEVLNNDPGNEEARAMYNQGRKMSKALKYEENHDYDKAIEELNDIVNINNGSSLIKKVSINKKEELEKLQSQKEEDALNRKSNAKNTSKKYKQKEEVLLEEIEKEKAEENESEGNNESKNSNLDNEYLSDENDTDNNQKDKLYEEQDILYEN